MANTTVNNDSRLNPKNWKKPEWVKKLKEELKKAPASDSPAIYDPEHYEGNPAPANNEDPSQNASTAQATEDNPQAPAANEPPVKENLKGKARLREELEKVRDKFNPHRKIDRDNITCENHTVEQVIGDFENNSIKINNSNLNGLEQKVQDLRNDNPDKGYYMAREALILTRTDKKKNVEEAKKLFEDAKKLAPSDVRISMLEAGFNIMLGEYDKAIKIYEGAVKEAKKTGKACDLEAISYDLVRFDVLLNSEIASAQSEKRKEALKGVLTIIKLAVNPQSIVDLAIGEIISDAFFVERKEYKPDELMQFKGRVDEMTKKSVEDLTKTGDVNALIDLNNKVIGEYSEMEKKLDEVENARDKENLPSDVRLSQTRDSYISILTYFYPLVTENAIKAAKENKDVKALALLGDTLTNFAINIPSYSSNASALKGRYTDLCEKAYVAEIELADDKATLASIGKQLVAIGKYKSALNAYEKLSAGEQTHPVELGYAYLAAGEIEKAKKVFLESSGEELSILNSGKCEDLKVNGADLSGEDMLRLRSILKLLNDNPMAANIAVASFFHEKGRIVIPESIVLENNILTLNEVKIKELKVVGEKKNKKLAEWIQYMGSGALAPGKPFDVNELNAAMSCTSGRLGTFQPSPSDWKWWIEEEDGGAVVYIDLKEDMRKYIEVGALTSTSGKDDIRGIANFKWRFPSGRDVALGISAGELEGKTVVDGSVSFYDPDFIEINDRKYFTDISVFKNSYINYLEDRNEEMTGAGIKIGTEIGKNKNTNVWLNPKVYGVRDGGGTIGIIDLYFGFTYDSRIDKDNKGTFFSIYGGPGASAVGAFFKIEANAKQNIPLPNGSTLVILGRAGAGTAGLPSNELFFIGRNQQQFHGFLSEPEIGNLLLIGGAELRSKTFNLGAGFKVQPYLYIEAGATSELSKLHFKFIPWGGAGIRILSPVIGWINLFMGWPLDGTTANPQFGFTFDDSIKP